MPAPGKQLQYARRQGRKTAKKADELHHGEIDNQSTEEEIEQPLSQKELKKLRQLLKTGAKGGKKSKRRTDKLTSPDIG